MYIISFKSCPKYSIRLIALCFYSLILQSDAGAAIHYMYNSQIESRYSYKMVAQNTVLTSEVNYVKGICLHRQQLQILNHFQEKSDSFNTRAIFLIYHLIQVPWIGYSNGRFGRCDINQQTNFPQL